MRTSYHLTVESRCPVNASIDVYETVVESTGLIKVEDILSTVQRITALGPIFQEDLTRQLAERLGARVITTGYHLGVKTVCEC
jgi:hypothetical protein